MSVLFSLDSPATEEPPLPYLAALHERQQLALADKGLEKAYLCGRRSGKSHLLACELLAGAEANPGEMSVYVGITKGHARRNLGSTLQRIHRELDKHTGVGLPGRLTERDGQLFFAHNNGHLIWLAGCKHVNDADKFRGDYYTRVVIDEGQSFPLGVLKYMINDVLKWASLDKRAPITIAGTPGQLPMGFFYEVTTGDYENGKGQPWSTHTWTMFENPHIEDPRTWLDDHMANRGWTDDHPTVQREVYAQWVKDESAIIYPYDAARNACWDPPPPEQFDFRVLSIDLGWNDDTTFTVTGSKRDLGKVWIVRSYGKTEQTPAQIAAEIHRLRQQYQGFNRIVVDTGGIGKQLTEGLRRDYGLPCEAADKQGKAAAIRFVSDSIRAGQVLFQPSECAQLIGEMGVLPWNMLRTDHHEQYADHCCDGMLYGVRAHPVFERWDKEPPQPGTSEAADAEMARHREDTSREIKLQQRQDLSPARKRRILAQMRRRRN